MPHGFEPSYNTALYLHPQRTAEIIYTVIPSLHNSANSPWSTLSHLRTSNLVSLSILSKCCPSYISNDLPKKTQILIIPHQATIPCASRTRELRLGYVTSSVSYAQLLIKFQDHGQESYAKSIADRLESRSAHSFAVTLARIEFDSNITTRLVGVPNLKILDTRNCKQILQL